MPLNSQILLDIHVLVPNVSNRSPRILFPRNFELPLTVSSITQSEISARDPPNYDFYHLNEVKWIKDNEKNYMKKVYIMELMSRQYPCLPLVPTCAVALSRDLGSHHEELSAWEVMGL